MSDIEWLLCRVRTHDIGLAMDFFGETDFAWVVRRLAKQSPGHAASDDMLVATGHHTKAFGAIPFVWCQPVLARRFHMSWRVRRRRCMPYGQSVFGISHKRIRSLSIVQSPTDGFRRPRKTNRTQPWFLLARPIQVPCGRHR